LELCGAEKSVTSARRKSKIFKEEVMLASSFNHLAKVLGTLSRKSHD
jgi:hypothetical protein